MKINAKIIIHLTIAFLIVTVYCIFVKNKPLFEWIIFSITFVLIIYSTIRRKKLWDSIKNDSIDKYVSLVSLEIALIAFIQTSIQVEKNNNQFEENRIASESLFLKQMEHTQQLNELQIETSKSLNKTLTEEIIRLQEINVKQNESAQIQLELSEQSLQDYLFDTKAELSIELTKITNTDTLKDSKVQLTITSNIKNTGRREASKVELRNMIIHVDKSIIEMSISDEAENFTGNKVIQNHYYPIMSIEEAKNFYYWIQVKYEDEKTGTNVDRSFYYHYYESAGKFDFYYAKTKDKRILRDIIDKELKSKNLTLTEN
nr:hypothetical protein [uncultured Draconibacterium sp.]